MAEFSIHRPDVIRASVNHHPAGTTAFPFTALRISTAADDIVILVSPDRAAWAEGVVASINAPVSQPVEVAA